MRLMETYAEPKRKERQEEESEKVPRSLFFESSTVERSREVLDPFGGKIEELFQSSDEPFPLWFEEQFSPLLKEEIEQPETTTTTTSVQWDFSYEPISNLEEGQFMEIMQSNDGISFSDNFILKELSEKIYDQLKNKKWNSTIQFDKLVKGIYDDITSLHLSMETLSEISSNPRVYYNVFVIAFVLAEITNRKKMNILHPRSRFATAAFKFKFSHDLVNIFNDILGQLLGIYKRNRNIINQPFIVNGFIEFIDEHRRDYENGFLMNAIHLMNPSLLKKYLSDLLESKIILKVKRERVRGKLEIDFPLIFSYKSINELSGTELMEIIQRNNNISLFTNEIYSMFFKSIRKYILDSDPPAKHSIQDIFNKISNNLYILFLPKDKMELIQSSLGLSATYYDLFIMALIMVEQLINFQSRIDNVIGGIRMFRKHKNLPFDILKEMNANFSLTIGQLMKRTNIPIPLDFLNYLKGGKDLFPNPFLTDLFFIVSEKELLQFFTFLIGRLFRETTRKPLSDITTETVPSIIRKPKILTIPSINTFDTEELIETSKGYFISSLNSDPVLRFFILRFFDFLAMNSQNPVMENEKFIYSQVVKIVNDENLSLKVMEDIIVRSKYYMAFLIVETMYALWDPTTKSSHPKIINTWTKIFEKDIRRHKWDFKEKIKTTRELQSADNFINYITNVIPQEDKLILYDITTFFTPQFWKDKFFELLVKF